MRNDSRKGMTAFWLKPVGVLAVGIAKEGEEARKGLAWGYRDDHIEGLYGGKELAVTM